jgi:adenosyl cobinamide kinase/adenosyl cobinamide phosphate guanylyltransferase
VSLVFLLGGARSGKSALALQLARDAAAPVTVIATAEALDDEMAERIRLHRAQRPADWDVVEEPLELERVLDDVGDERTLVIDCVSLWIANLLERGESDDQLEQRAKALAGRAARRPALTVAVSNEVGLGVVPPTPLGRRYRDVLGRVNTVWASAADEAAFLIAGRALRLESLETLVP